MVRKQEPWMKKEEEIKEKLSRISLLTKETVTKMDEITYYNIINDLESVIINMEQVE